jgi:pilus assembly protein CpaE
MSDKPNVLLLGASPQRELTIRIALKGVADVRTDRLAAATQGLGNKLGYRIALIDLAGSPEVALQVMEDLAAVNPHIPVVALAEHKDPDLILRAMRAGAREFALTGGEGELARVVGELLRKMSSEAPTGSIISLFPAKGGIGSTTLAVNLAGALLEGDKRVVLVDLNLQLGDVLVFLDCSGGYSIADLLKNMDRLDRDLLMASLAKHRSGVHVLAQTDNLEEADRIQPGQLSQLLHFLARHFDYVVCDGLRSFDESAIAALDASQRILLTVSQNVPALKNAQRCIDVFRQLGYDDGKVNLVVNRSQKSESIDLESVSDNLGLAIRGFVTNDYPTVSGAINRGLLLFEDAPRARVTEDFRRLALAISGSPSRNKKAGFLQSLFRKGGAGAEAPGKEESVREPERKTQAV